MDQGNHREYYLTRAAASRAMAVRATDPLIAKVHEDFATHYDEAATRIAPTPLGTVMG